MLTVLLLGYHSKIGLRKKLELVGTPLVMSVVCQNQRAPTASCERQYLYLQIQPKALISKIPGFFFLLPAPRLDPAPRLQAILLMRACSRQCAMP